MQRASAGPRPAARVLAAGVVLALLAACGASSPEAAPDPRPDVEAIREARAAFAEPAAALGTQVKRVEAAVRALRIDVPASDASGGPDVPARTFLLQQATDATDELRTMAAVPVAPSLAEIATDPVVVRANAAWSRALSSADVTVSEAGVEVALAQELLDVEVALAATAALWDERGSRAEQTQRLDAAADDAEALVAGLQGRVDVPACSTALARRAAAAELVAARTRELHGYVSRGQGTSFDEARASYDLAPWHDGLVTLDHEEGSCWDGGSVVARSSSLVLAAINELVAALNTGVDLPSSDGASG